MHQDLLAKLQTEAHLQSSLSLLSNRAIEEARANEMLLASIQDSSLIQQNNGRDLISMNLTNDLLKLNKYNELVLD